MLADAFGGGSRTRTGVHGFSGRCMTPLPSPRGTEQKKEGSSSFPGAFPSESGGGTESRPRALNLGKVALYKLSYPRERVNYINGHRREAAPCACSRALRSRSAPPRR